MVTPERAARAAAMFGDRNTEPSWGAIMSDNVFINVQVSISLCVCVCVCVCGFVCFLWAKMRALMLRCVANWRRGVCMCGVCVWRCVVWCVCGGVCVWCVVSMTIRCEVSTLAKAFLRASISRALQIRGILGLGAAVEALEEADCMAVNVSAYTCCVFSRAFGSMNVG